MLKSLLFVPGDSEKKMAKAGGTNASGLILDLEDSVAAERTDIARNMVRAYLLNRADRGRQQLWVRINAFSDPACLPDLAAIVAGTPDGIMLPKVDSAHDVVVLDHYLTALEHREGVAPGSIRILPVVTETPAAMFALSSYKGCSKRLAGLTWGAEDLSAAVGAESNHVENGEYKFTYQLARSLCLLGAHAADVQAIETISTNFRDKEALLRDVRASRRAGFNGKMAIHPDQVDTINSGFARSEAEIALVKAVVQALEDAKLDAGAVQLDRRMLDKPHLVQALRMLSAVT